VHPHGLRGSVQEFVPRYTPNQVCRHVIDRFLGCRPDGFLVVNYVSQNFRGILSFYLTTFTKLDSTRGMRRISCKELTFYAGECKKVAVALFPTCKD